MKFSDVMKATGATRPQLWHWANNFLGRPRNGRGNHYEFTKDEVELIAHAVNAVRAWGPSAAKRVIVDGARLPHGVSSHEWMVLFDLRRGNTEMVTRRRSA